MRVTFLQLWPVIIIMGFASRPYALAQTAASNLEPGQQWTGAWEEVGLSAWGATNIAKGQSFIAEAGGQLQSLNTLISAGADDRISNSPPLNISICTSNGGVPSLCLAQVTRTALDFQPILQSDNHLVSIDFSDFGISIIKGNEYMVLYECPYPIVGPDSDYSPFFVGTIANGPSSLGRQNSFSQDGHNWEFLTPAPEFTFELATQVILVPEPVFSELLLFAALSMGTHRNRQSHLH